MRYKKMEPKPGHSSLQVVVIGRVSTEHQPKSNIEAGYAYAERTIKDVTDGSYVVQRFGEQASGMTVERQSIHQAISLIDSGWADLVLMEDVSKSYRNPRWIMIFVQNCVDAEVRVIAPGDSLDTWDENWEVVLGTAALRHGLHIPDTRRRIRRTSAQTFDRGGMVLRVRYGYRKLSQEQASGGEHGTQGLRLAKIPEATPLILQLQHLVVQERMGGQRLARWLNDQGISPGPYAKNGKWSGRLVLDLLRDPLLYGLRQFPKVVYQPLFATGKHKRRKNLTAPQKLYPELAHMSQEQWEQMVAVLDELGDRASRRSGVDSPRYRIARRDSYSPLQHAVCAVCGGFLYLVGNDVIKCGNALNHHDGTCWNHVQVNCTIVRQKLVEILLDRVQQVPRAWDLLMTTAWEEIRNVHAHSRNWIAEIDKELEDLKKQEQRITDAIATGGPIEVLVQRLTSIQTAMKDAVRREKQALEHGAEDELPSSLSTLELNAKAALLQLASSSFEFSRFLRRIFPCFRIQPIQQLDCDQVRPRGLLELDLSSLLPGEPGHAKRELVVVDFFEPPEHIRHLSRIVTAKRQAEHSGEKCTLDKLSFRLNVHRMTIKRALSYHGLMAEEAMEEPYRVLRARPKRASRWKPRDSQVNGTGSRSDACSMILARC